MLQLSDVGVALGYVDRSSNQRCSVKKGVFNISKVHRKTTVMESLFNKVAGPKASYVCLYEYNLKQLEHLIITTLVLHIRITWSMFS